MAAVIVLIFLAEPITLLMIVNANPFPQTKVQILSPKPWEEETYQTSTIPVEIQIDTPTQSPKIMNIYVILDLNFSSNNNHQQQLSISSPQSTVYFGSGTLEHLSNGAHTLDAFAVDAQGKTSISGTKNFLINATSIYPTDNSQQPFARSSITIALVIVLTVVAIGIVTSVILFKKKYKK